MVGLTVPDTVGRPENSVEITPNEIELTYRFDYYLGSLSSLPYGRITVTTPDGVSGSGEIACALDINGETSQGITALLGPIQSVLRDRIIHSTDDVTAIMRDVNLHIVGNAAAKCGLEQALYSIVAQGTGQSLAELLGPTKSSLKIQCTIPFYDSIEGYIQEFRRILPKKPEYVKFKIGKNFRLEREAIYELRARDRSIKISVDANQAFRTVHEAEKFLDTFPDDAIAWVEQPLHRDDIRGLRTLRKRLRTPIMLDESLQTPREAELFFANGLTDYVNIKPPKHGGIGVAREIIELARDYGVKPMLGSMLHGPEGLLYMLAFGLSEDFVTHDFYSYFSLKTPPRPPLIDAKTLCSTPAVLGKGSSLVTPELRLPAFS